MKKISLLIILLIEFSALSQSKFEIETNLGISFQSKMLINNESLDNINAFGLRLGVNFIKIVHNKFYIETGLYGKYNKNNNEIRTTKFTSNSLKLQLPLYIGYTIDKTWKINIGASIENNRDFNEIDFKREENLRYDLLTKLIYVFNKKIHFSLYTNWMLNQVSDSFTISVPKNGIYFGIIYQLRKK
tara:strand:+ start:169 stop:729 length:561 start_codon:yes stop_codon:yes gene_type:complete